MNADDNGVLLSDGYDEPLNEGYANKPGSLSGFMYASTTSTNSDQKDVKLKFKRYDAAQLLICFYESIPGWRVEILNLNDNTELGDGQGTLASGFTNNYKSQGVQAVPAKRISDTSNSSNLSNITYTKEEAVYVTDIKGSSLSVDFTSTSEPVSITDQDTLATGVNLMFKVPEGELSTASIAPANLGSMTVTPAGETESVTYSKLIPDSVTDGSTQTYSYSPTVYYPVEQGDVSSLTTDDDWNALTGFTFHITFRMINEVTGEVITVHNASVFVPPYFVDNDNNKVPLTYWQNNTRYTYRFRITKDVNGSTNPDTAIDPSSPTPDIGHALHPIVFEGVSVESFDSSSAISSESDIREGNVLKFEQVTTHNEGDGFSDGD